MTTLLLAPEYLPQLLSGQKRTTIRRGVRELPVGPATIQAGEQTVPVRITGVRVLFAGDLTENHARADGFASLADLWAALQRFYPDLSLADAVTVVTLGV